MTSVSSYSSAASLLLQQAQTRQSMFQKADTDSSGGLSLDEFKAAGPKDAQGNAIAPPSGAPSIEDIFAGLDTDGDGSLTQSEMEAGFAKKPASGGQHNALSSDMLSQLISQLSDDQKKSIFSSADADGDGNLNQDEFNTAVKDIVTTVLGDAGADGSAAGGPPPGGPPPGGSKGGGGSQSASTKVYDALDTNKDGTVSLDELLAANGGDDDSSSSDVPSLADLLKSDDDRKDAVSAKDIKADFMKILLSAQEQQQAA